MNWEYVVSFLITIVNIIAMILQLKKVFEDYKKENGLEGLSFWAFTIWTFLVMIVLAYMFRTKKYFFDPLYIMSFFYFVLIAIMIVYYEKTQESKDADSHVIALPVIFVFGLGTSIFLLLAKKIISNKLLTKISDVAGIGIGLCMLPYVIRVYEHGDAGVSFLFLVLTLAANIAEIFSSILTKTWPTLATMIIYLITKSMVVAKIFEYTDSQKENKKLNDMKSQLGGAGGLCGGLIILLFVARYLDKKKHKP